VGQQKRLEYWESVRDIEARNLVFLDEMGVLLGLMRSRARRLKGLRAYCIKPFYRGKRVTVMGAMSQDRVLAIETLGLSMKGDDFRRFVQTQLVPQLWKGAVVVMDNLRAHKVAGVQDMIESVGARIVYLSPYSPEFNPIEHLWSQLKSFLRRFCPKTEEAVDELLKLAMQLSNPKHFRNWFAHCCYCL
jgi:transposase